MTDDSRLKVHVWVTPQTDAQKVTSYAFKEVGHGIHEFPGYEFREFCQEVDDYWENRYSEGGWIIEPIFTVPEGVKGEPLNAEQQRELEGVLQFEQS